MKIVWKAALASAALCAVHATSAHAAISVDGTACVSVASPQGCLFNGNINGNPANQNGYVAAQDAYNLYNNSVPSANPDIVLNYLGDTDAGFPGTFTGAGGLSGTWTMNPGYVVNFIAVKSSDRFILYALPTPLSSGTWSTAGLLNKKGKQQALSHLMFFGQNNAVPEPATWMMMIAGFGLIGGMMRRRKAAAALA